MKLDINNESNLFVELPSKRKFENLTGKTFYRLTVLGYGGKRNNRYIMWVCICSCGKSEMKLVCHNELLSSTTKSCGCLKKEHIPKNKSHNLSKTPIYHIWSTMKARCYNIKSQKYPNYGGRGITVCDEWLESFENFYKDMGDRPSDKHSIERKNNDGNYCKENCEWATNKQQSRNRRSNKYFECGGERLNIEQLSEKLNLSVSSIRTRQHRGWSEERIVNTPNKKKKNDN